jgi:hypothetical protein
MYACRIIINSIDSVQHARRRMYPSEQLTIRIVDMDVCCMRRSPMLLVLLDETVIRAGVGVNSPMIDSLA